MRIGWPRNITFFLFKYKIVWIQGVPGNWSLMYTKDGHHMRQFAGKVLWCEGQTAESLCQSYRSWNEYTSHRKPIDWSHLRQNQAAHYATMLIGETMQFLDFLRWNMEHNDGTPKRHFPARYALIKSPNVEYIVEWNLSLLSAPLNTKLPQCATPIFTYL